MIPDPEDREPPQEGDSQESDTLPDPDDLDAIDDDPDGTL